MEHFRTWGGSLLSQGHAYLYFLKCLLHCLFAQTNFFAVSIVFNVSVIDLWQSKQRQLFKWSFFMMPLRNTVLFEQIVWLQNSISPSTSKMKWFVKRSWNRIFCQTNFKLGWHFCHWTVRAPQFFVSPPSPHYPPPLLHSLCNGLFVW